MGSDQQQSCDEKRCGESNHKGDHNHVADSHQGLIPSYRTALKADRAAQAGREAYVHLLAGSCTSVSSGMPDSTSFHPIVTHAQSRAWGTHRPTSIECITRNQQSRIGYTSLSRSCSALG